MKLRALLLVSVRARRVRHRAANAHYNGGYPDADVFVGNQRFQLWFHPRDQTILFSAATRSRSAAPRAERHHLR